MKNQKKTVLQKPVTEKLKAGWQFRSKKREKIPKICRNDLGTFALIKLNYDKLNELLTGGL